jgi:uncharacterized membrane protein
MKKFLDRLDHDRVVAAIAGAEKKTSGEIRVHIHHRKVTDPLKTGTEVFEKLGMTNTRERNGVLLFVAPKSRNFAVLGDTAVHEKCGTEFWEKVASAMRESFREGKFTEGIVAAVAEIGDLLAAHFPAAAKDQDELSNEIDES